MDKKPDAPDKYKVKLDYERPKPKTIGGKMLLPVKEERNENNVNQNEGEHSYCIF